MDKKVLLRPSQAAEELHMSAPTLRRYARALESEVGGGQEVKLQPGKGGHPPFLAASPSAVSRIVSGSGLPSATAWGNPSSRLRTFQGT